MIYIKVEMWPFGRKEEAYDLGEIKIANVGQDEKPGRFSYRYNIKRAGKARGKRADWKNGKISDFPRKQRNVYDLMFRVLREVVGDRNG